MTGHIAALYRHPVKGFTPERLSHAELTAGGPFPCDRLYAVENGPSGFDPAAPVVFSLSNAAFSRFDMSLRTSPQSFAQVQASPQQAGNAGNAGNVGLPERRSRHSRNSASRHCEASLNAAS